MSNLRTVLFLSLLVAAAGCRRGDSRADLREETPRYVSILVEVYDPATNLVWENVSVRIVEADQEWSQCTCESPYEDWYLTDGNGRVLLSEADLAYAEVGFQEDGAGRAVIGARRDEDQATVVLEVDALGFVPKLVVVPLSWDQPDVFVEVPFE